MEAVKIHGGGIILTNVNVRDLADESWVKEFYNRFVDLASAKAESVIYHHDFKEAVDICNEYRHYCIDRHFGRTLFSLVATRHGSYDDFVSELAFKMRLSQRHYNYQISKCFFRITTNAGEDIF